MSSTVDRITGQVKWFNVKAGYGFITVIKGTDDILQKDIFVHFSSLNVKNTQYRYLVQGEYVEFELVKPASDKYEFHAANVSGICSGTLLCENRVNNTPRGPPAHLDSVNDPSGGFSEDGFQTVLRKHRKNNVAAK